MMDRMFWMMLTWPFFPHDFTCTALAKLAQQDSDRLSDEAILKELALSSKNVEVEALSGEWI